MTTPAEAIAVLNRALDADPGAVRGLFGHRVECNETLVDDPTIQVCAAREGEPATVSILGLLNGVFGIQESGWGYIAARYEIQCHVHGQERAEFAGLRVGDPCPLDNCQHPLVLGDLVRFKECER